MSAPLQTSYDEVPYTSYPFAQSHPDKLSSVSWLFGLPSPPVERCRVLELGCAAGGNLIPMAELLPESTFVGIDTSQGQLAEGRQTIDALGLKNITLGQMSIADVGPDFGTFDYIVCHGVYSYVPAAVQEHLLTVCRQNLSPQGVAYVSYNALPGWHMRGLIRDMMLFHCNQFADPWERARQARLLLDFLVRASAGSKNPYSDFLSHEQEYVKDKADFYLLHEYLEDRNAPCYFSEFMQRARAKGLRYLGETDLSVMVLGNFPPEVQSTLASLSPDMLQREQYMDFVRYRAFRETLLCHQEREPQYNIQFEHLATFHVASPARPVSQVCDLGPYQVEHFQTPAGYKISSREPIVKAAMVILAETWPQSMPLPTLRALARSRLQPGPADSGTMAQDTQQLAQTFLRCHATGSNNLVELFVRPMTLACRAGDRPCARPLARWQASRGDYVTNLRHEVIELGAFARQVIRHLDGQHTRSALLQILGELIRRGELTVQHEGEVVRDPGRVESLLQQALDDQLTLFAYQSLLMEPGAAAGRA